MLEMTIKIETRDQAEQISEVLMEAEENGELDFSFGVQIVDTDNE